MHECLNVCLRESRPSFLTFHATSRQLTARAIHTYTSFASLHLILVPHTPNTAH